MTVVDGLYVDGLYDGEVEGLYVGELERRTIVVVDGNAVGSK